MGKVVPLHGPKKEQKQNKPRTAAQKNASLRNWQICLLRGSYSTALRREDYAFCQQIDDMLESLNAEKESDQRERLNKELRNTKWGVAVAQ